MNGPHPVVGSYLQENRSVQGIKLESGVSAPGIEPRVLACISEQIRLLTDSSLQQRLLNALNFWEQVSIEAQALRHDCLFLHTTPLYAGTRPWIFHFESFPSLFAPFIRTGLSSGIDLKAHDFFWLVQDRLESRQCLRIFSHMQESLEILKRVFGSPIIAQKCHYVPLGISTVDASVALQKFAPGNALRILFTNSLHNEPQSFYLRGGHHVLEAFSMIRGRRSDVQLTIISAVPDDLMQRFAPTALLGVTWIDHRIDDMALNALFLESHILALPAAALHSHSLLRAFAHGCVPLISDAPGYDEYIQDFGNRMMRVCGVRELVYRDEADGWISDNYEPFGANWPSLIYQIFEHFLANIDPGRLMPIAASLLDHCRKNQSAEGSQSAFNGMLGI